MSSVYNFKQLSDFFESVPKADLTYIQKLSNQTGIFQHASFNIPNYHHGYCLDDNGRALLLLVMAAEVDESFSDHPLVSTYLSFIHYAQNDDGTFKNFMSFDLKFLEERGSEDSMGRTMWAIGNLLSNSRFRAHHDVTQEIFNGALDNLRMMKSPRAVAYALVGVLKFIEANPKDEHAKTEAKALIEFLENEFNVCSTQQWPWFEEIISYDNAILPLAMLMAGRIFDNQKWKAIGNQSFAFLDLILFRNGHLSIIGNEGWYPKDGPISNFGQQPVEIPTIILLYQEASLHDSDIKWLDRMQRSFLWYLGMNDKGASLYDAANKSCADGLEDYGANKNQGAESNIAFWMAYALIKKIDFTVSDEPSDATPAGLPATPTDERLQ